MLLVPLLSPGEKVVGVISADKDKIAGFDQSDRQLLETLTAQAAIAVENARLYKRVTEQSEALRRIVASIGPASDPLPTILEEACKLLGAEYGSFSLADAAQKHLLSRAVWEKDHVLWGEQIPSGQGVLSWGKGVVGHVARTGQLYCMCDVINDPYYEQWHESTVSELAVPLNDSRGKIIGVLNLESPRQDAFGLSEQALCQDLARIATVAMEKDQLFDTMQRLNAQLDNLHQIVEEQSLVGVLDHILASIIKILGEGTSASINLYAEATHTFSGYRAAGDLGAYLLEVPPRSSGHSTSQHVLSTRKPLWLDDVSTPPAGCPTIREKSIERGVKSFAALPLKRQKQHDEQEQIVGILYINLQIPFYFTEEIQRTLELFAHQAAVAIENARLYETLEQSNQSLERKNMELEILTEMSREAISDRGIDQILDLVYIQAGKILDLTNAQVQIAFYDEVKDEVTFPLAVEKENGKEIDRIRFGKRGDEPVEQFSSRARGQRFGLNEYIIQSHKPLLIAERFTDMAAELGITVWPTFGRLNRPTHSWLGVPMMVGDRVIGVISIQTLKPTFSFQPEDLVLLSTVARQAAVAIENARLYDAVVSQQGKIADIENQLVRDKVAADLVHRLNNMLGTIPIRIQLIREILDDPKEHPRVLKYLDGVANDAKRVMDQTKQIQLVPMSEEITDLRMMLEAMVDEALLSAERPIKKTLECPAELLPLHTVRISLSNALRFVIDNAIQSMANQGQNLGVIIRENDLCNNRREIEIRITDDGPSIPQAVRERIFQAGVTTKEDGKGYGLWRARYLIESDLGGKLVLEPDEFPTTFSFHLPIRLTFSLHPVQ